MNSKLDQSPAYRLHYNDISDQSAVLASQWSESAPEGWRQEMQHTAQQLPKHTVNADHHNSYIQCIPPKKTKQTTK